MTIRGLKRFLRLSNHDRFLAARAFVVLVKIDLDLRSQTFQRLLERIPPAGANRRVASMEDVGRARRYAYWLDVASRHHVVSARCLHRSLALHTWLRRQGLPSELQIGVRKDASALKAHAWVVLDGHVVNDSAEAISNFTPLTSPKNVRSLNFSEVGLHSHG